MRDMSSHKGTNSRLKFTKTPAPTGYSSAVGTLPPSVRTHAFTKLSERGIIPSILIGPLVHWYLQFERSVETCASIAW